MHSSEYWNLQNNTSVRVDQICIFQEWHFNGIKTEMKEIYDYLPASVTDHDLILK